MRALTYALRAPETAKGALACLKPPYGPGVYAALYDLIEASPQASLVTGALALLKELDVPLAREAMLGALRSSFPSVRIQALGHLSRALPRLEREFQDAFFEVCGEILREDPAWSVRQVAVAALAKAPLVTRDALGLAVNDPHWRVRSDLLRYLSEEAWRAQGAEGSGGAEGAGASDEAGGAGASDETVPLVASEGATGAKASEGSIFAGEALPSVASEGLKVLEHVGGGFVAELPYESTIGASQSRARGFGEALHFRRLEPEKKGAFVARLSRPQPSARHHALAWWDDDPPVVRKRLKALGEAECLVAMEHFAALLHEDDEGIRRFVIAKLRLHGTTKHLLACFRRLWEPRTPYLRDGLERLAQGLNLDRKEALALALLEDPLNEPTHAVLWALAQFGADIPLPGVQSEAPWPQLLSLLPHPDARVRVAVLQASAALME